MEHVGTKPVLWGSIGTELLGVVFDMRYMVMLSIVLILTDLWWGHSESMVRYKEALKIDNAVLINKYKWHKSRAIRRTCNKLVDYITYLVLGALFGLAITEPMGICDHIVSASVGLGLGCLCEVSSIIGHIVYVKFGVEMKIKDIFKYIKKFIIAVLKKKSNDVGEALEETFDKEKNMED